MFFTCVKNCPSGFKTLRDFSITSSRNCHSLFWGLIDKGMSVKSEKTKSKRTLWLFSLSSSVRQSPTMIYVKFETLVTETDVILLLCYLVMRPSCGIKR